MRKILSLTTILLLGFVLVACAKDTYTVTFDSNGGSAISAITDIAKDSTITAPTAPTRTNYVFAGWFKESSLTNAWDFATDKVTANITLYAKWDAAGPTDQQAVDATFDWLNIGNISALTNSSPRLILPTTYSAQGVSISWTIDKLQFIAANGVITQPTHEEGNQSVTLTATMTKGTVNRTKVFNATVVALPPIEDTLPIINETFDYANGNILTQSTIWGPVSGKTGNSVFTVVDTITGMSIPNDSKALKIEAYLELQIEAPIVHTYDLVVFEVDLMQTTSSNGSPINIQSSSSSPVVAFGLDGAALFYRTDNGALIKTNININQWYTLRAEVNLTNKTLEVFYYEDGQLISMTPGPVTFTGTTPLQGLFIRSGSSNTTALRAPAYVTNIIANRIEALPRPAEEIKLGAVEGIRPTVSVEENAVFTPDTPVIHNYFGSQRALILTTEYTLAVNNPVDTAVAGDYVVTYTFTNVADATDVKVVTQEVTVYAVGQPNEITGTTSTTVGYLETNSDITITLVQPQGTLYYLLSSNASETAAAIMLGSSVAIEGVTVLLDDLNVGSNTHIHFVVSLNGQSNVWSHALSFEAVNMITTKEQFYAMASVETALSYALANDLDFTGFTWATTAASFKGKLYGNGFAVRNLTMASTAQYGGIFSRANGAVIRDLILDNINVVSTARGGALIGRVENVSVLIENVMLINSNVQGADANGVGGLIGHAANQVTLKNVAVIDTVVTAVGVKNVGGVVGRVGGGSANTLFATDVFVKNVTVNAQVSGTDLGAGVFVGYVTDNAASIVNANRVIVVDSTVNSVMGGALIGYLRAPGTATANNIYVEVTFAGTDVTHAGLIARVNDSASYLDQTSIFGSFTGAVQNAQTQDLANTFVPTNQAWWSTNLPTFVNNDLWSFGTNGVFELILYTENSKPMVVVTLDYNFDIPDQVIEVRQDNEFSHGAPLVAGYNFVGWFTDASLVTPLPSGYVITVPVTLYGKYEALPLFDVTFNVDGGSAVALIQVYQNDKITEPTAPTKDGYTFEGWYKEAEFTTLWNFGTDLVTANTTLFAKWEAIPSVTYTVSFEENGGSAVADLLLVGEGTTITAPTAPTKDGYTFEGWYKEAELTNLWIFASDLVTANITLYAKWEVEPDLPLGTSITTAQEFHDMTKSGSTETFYLANDIDFTGFTWTVTGTGTSFRGTLNGNGKTISNITIAGSGTGVYGGIFQRTNGAVINNLTVDNAHVDAVGRVGVLIGRVETGETVLNKVVIKNSSAAGTAGEGVGILIGNAATAFTITNLQIISSTAFNSGKNVGYI
ncbi:MAG: InlB B-repeat-containing protein, partial [Acholeplasmataceae bacterium]|nr:InlB B-repeat-containing protein [Acholeplasmataceae bacterium]